MLLFHVLEIAVVLELAELFLLKMFSQWYFRFGPRLLELSAEAPRRVSLEQVDEALRGIPYLATRRQGPGLLLIRRRATSLPSRFDAPPVASPRMVLTHVSEHTTDALRLELRHSLFSTLLAVLLLLPLCAGLSLVVGADNPLLGIVILAVLWTSSAAVVHVALVSSAKVAARRVWREATSRLGIAQP